MAPGYHPRSFLVNAALVAALSGCAAPDPERGGSPALAEAWDHDPSLARAYEDGPQLDPNL